MSGTVLAKRKSETGAAPAAGNKKACTKTRYARKHAVSLPVPPFFSFACCSLPQLQLTHCTHAARTDRRATRAMGKRNVRPCGCAYCATWHRTRSGKQKSKNTGVTMTIVVILCGRGRRPAGCAVNQRCTLGVTGLAAPPPWSTALTPSPVRRTAPKFD